MRSATGPNRAKVEEMSPATNCCGADRTLHTDEKAVKEIFSWGDNLFVVALLPSATRPRIRRQEKG